MELQILGGLVFLLGVGLLIGQRQVWSKNRNYEQNSEEHLRFLRARYVRRSYVSSLLTLLGVMLIVGTLIDKFQYPSFFVIFWVMVMLLACVMALLGLWDMLSSRRFITGKVEIVNARRKEMEKQLNLLKQHQAGKEDQN